MGAPEQRMAGAGAPFKNFAANSAAATRRGASSAKTSMPCAANVVAALMAAVRDRLSWLCHG
jgi:hypothetical protein